MREREKAMQVEQQMQQFAQMQKELQEAKDEIIATRVIHEHVQDMFNNGLLKERPEGGYDVVDDPNERIQIKQQFQIASKQRPPSQADSASVHSGQFNHPLLEDSGKEDNRMIGQ